MPAFPHAGQATTIAPALTLRSPAFTVRPPSVRNLDLVHPTALAAMQAVWQRGSFPAHDVHVFDIPGGYLSEACLIFDDELRVIANASDAYTAQEIERAIRGIHALLAQQTLPHFGMPGIVAKRRPVSNYGHFLLEMLPMAVLAARHCSDPAATFVLHRVPPPMLDATLRCFRRLNVPIDRLRITDYGEPMHFERLVVVRGLTEHGSYMSPLCTDAVAAMADGVAPDRHRKLFLMRAPGCRRRLANQQELHKRLKAHGFHSIEPGQLTLEQQIAALKGADLVVGVAGAALANIVFCRPGTRVISLAGADFCDTFFWFIATHRTLAYSEIRGDKLGGDALEPAADFRIRDADIAWLETLEGGADPNQNNGVTAHLHELGDIHGSIGEWIGGVGRGQWVEGFQIESHHLRGHLQYRAVLGRNWLSPWVGDCGFCGTRGMGLPLYGLSLRLDDELSRDLDCVCNARFADGSCKTGVPAGEPCMTDSLTALEAFQIVLRPKTNRAA